ncbi:hypothetical protein C2E23DRAFT_744019, partial [Lenzites betulinus]
QSLVSTARWGVIYEVRSTRARLILLPAKEDWDPACGAYANTEDLDTDRWFQEDPIIDSVHCFPGTDCGLLNGYDILSLQPYGDRDTAGANNTVHRLFSMEWTGNLIVVKRGRFDPSRAVHISRSEINLINTLVHRYVHVYLAKQT